MIPDLELRNFMYAMATTYVNVILIIIHNYSYYKKKKQIAGVPTLAIQGVFAKLAQKNKVFKPFASIMPWLIIEIFIISAIQMFIKAPLNRTFGIAVGMNSGNFFGTLFFMPLIIALISLVLWVNPLKQTDILTTFYPFTLCVDKFCGCFCAGCCNGLWWPAGMYNYATRRYEVPIQLIEAIVAFIIGIVLLKYKKKAKPGTMFPVFAILYSATRFVTEFWRGQTLIFGPFRYYHVFCAIGVVVGIVELILVNKYADKINLYFENTLYFSRKLRQKSKVFFSC